MVCEGVSGKESEELLMFEDQLPGGEITSAFAYGLFAPTVLLTS